MNSKDIFPPDDLDRLVQAQSHRLASELSTPPSRWILVDVSGQRLALVHQGKIVFFKPISTARHGVDCQQDSGGTPSGLHRVDEKIGEGAVPGTEFSSRKPTGRVWPDDIDDQDAGDLILTRILTLDGLEPGVNQGPGVDSKKRYIYIHGTNHETKIGLPVSHGCVRMKNDDVVELFDKVQPGDPVLIT